MESNHTPDSLSSVEVRISRRAALARLSGLVVAGGAFPLLAGCNGQNTNVPLPTLYPNLNGQFGGVIDVGIKTDFPAALPAKFKLNQAGVFYHQTARTYVVHLDKGTSYLLTGLSLENQLAKELVARDADGSYWLALYQRCVHLGATVAFRDDCARFKCPSHGAVYNCDGERMYGPAPRSMDRFPLSFQGERVLVDTGKIVNTPGPNDTPRMLVEPPGACM